MAGRLPLPLGRPLLRKLKKAKRVKSVSQWETLSVLAGRLPCLEASFEKTEKKQKRRNLLSEGERWRDAYPFPFREPSLLKKSKKAKKAKKQKERRLLSGEAVEQGGLQRSFAFLLFFCFFAFFAISEVSGSVLGNIYV